MPPAVRRAAIRDFRPHLMQGWAPDFISTLTEEAVDAGLIDEIVPVAGADALRLLARARAEGRHLRRHLERRDARGRARQSRAARRAGSNIVCMLPDTGERYLSTPLFEGIGEEMTAEEWEVSRSTPLCRFDAPAPTPAPAPAPAVAQKVAVDPAAARFVSEVARERTGRDVRARVVRVLLVGAQAVHAARHRLSQRRRRLGRVPEGRSRRQDPRRARRSHRREDAAADLRRRRAHRRRHRHCSMPGAMARCRGCWTRAA